MIEGAILAYLCIAIYRRSVRNGNSGCLGIIGLLMLAFIGELVGGLVGLFLFWALGGFDAEASGWLWVLVYVFGLVGFVVGVVLAFRLAERPRGARA